MFKIKKICFIIFCSLKCDQYLTKGQSHESQALIKKSQHQKLLKICMKSFNSICANVIIRFFYVLV